MRTKLVILVLLAALVLAGVLFYRSLAPQAPPAPRGDGKFVLVDAAERALDGTPALSLTFSQPLDPRTHYDRPRDPVWMVIGRLVARTSPGRGYAHRFTEPGRYEITAFDDAGLYDRISLSVR